VRSNRVSSKLSRHSWRFLVVMAGLVPAIPKVGHRALLIEIAGTSPAMTNWPPQILPLSLYASIGITSTAVVRRCRPDASTTPSIGATSA
jgi:hypothetical protein